MQHLHVLRLNADWATGLFLAAKYTLAQTRWRRFLGQKAPDRSRQPAAACLITEHCL